MLITTSGTYPWSVVTQIEMYFVTLNQVMWIISI